MWATEYPVVDLLKSTRYALWWVVESGVILGIVALTTFAITFQSSSFFSSLISFIIGFAGAIMIVRQLFARINDMIDEKLAESD